MESEKEHQQIQHHDGQMGCQTPKDQSTIEVNATSVATAVPIAVVAASARQAQYQAQEIVRGQSKAIEGETQVFDRGAAQSQNVYHLQDLSAAQEESSDSDRAPKKSALYGQWKTPPQPFFPSGSGGTSLAPANGTSRLAANPHSKEPCQVQAHVQPLGQPSQGHSTNSASLATSSNVPQTLPEGSTPDLSGMDLASLQEAYRRGMAAAAALSKHQMVTGQNVFAPVLGPPIAAPQVQQQQQPTQPVPVQTQHVDPCRDDIPASSSAASGRASNAASIRPDKSGATQPLSNSAQKSHSQLHSQQQIHVQTQPQVLQVDPQPQQQILGQLDSAQQPHHLLQRHGQLLGHDQQHAQPQMASHKHPLQSSSPYAHAQLPAPQTHSQSAVSHTQTAPSATHAQAQAQPPATHAQAQPPATHAQAQPPVHQAQVQPSLNHTQTLPHAHHSQPQPHEPYATPQSHDQPNPQPQPQALVHVQPFVQAQSPQHGLSQHPTTDSDPLRLSLQSTPQVKAHGQSLSFAQPQMDTQGQTPRQLSASHRSVSAPDFHRQAALEAGNMHDPSYDPSIAVSPEEEKRRKRLARNRASARLRRLRKKNLVESYEGEVTVLEQALAKLRKHKWGGNDEDYSEEKLKESSEAMSESGVKAENPFSSGDHTALLEALSMERGQQALDPQARRDLVKSILEQQREHVANMHEAHLEGRVLGWLVREGGADNEKKDANMVEAEKVTSNGGASVAKNEDEKQTDDEEAEIAKELRDLLSLAPEQEEQLRQATVGVEEEQFALETVDRCLEAMLENDWLVNQGVEDCIEQFTSIMNPSQVSKLLLWTDHNAEAIEQLDFVNAPPAGSEPAQSPVFSFGVDEVNIQDDNANAEDNK